MFRILCYYCVFATKGWHRGLDTFCKKPNVLYQRNLGRDVELKNTHIVLVKIFRDVMQVNAHSGQLRLRSRPVKCCWEAVFYPLKSHIYCIAAMNGTMITIINKQQIFSVDLMFPRMIAAFEVFGRWTNKIFSPYKCSNSFPAIGKVIAFSLCQWFSSVFSMKK